MTPPGALTALYPWDDALRSRSVSERVFTAVLDLPPAPARLAADWARDLAGHLALEAGDVDALSLPRARARWPDHRRWADAAAAWTRSLGLRDLLAGSEQALMACRGARYHHDAAQYAGAAFCNLFLSEDKGLDLRFAGTGRRIPLRRGTAVIFDTGQPHAVVPRGATLFDAADFGADRDAMQVFLTWELSIEDPDLARMLGIAFDTSLRDRGSPDAARLRLDDAPVDVCPATGCWLRG